MKLLPFVCALFMCLYKPNASIVITSRKNFLISEQKSTSQRVPKVLLTQKGYMQFLKYVVDVPEITEYTFCIWFKSNNLTYSHPLLSYSKHENERLIRVWISPYGQGINLELTGNLIFAVPVQFVENQWYHVCQSWSSWHGAWSFYLNGKLTATGRAPNNVIDSGGDLVVGQEYTDFDRGYEDGIEGDVSGFNFVLASTLPTNYVQKNVFKRTLQTHEGIKSDRKRSIWDGTSDPFAWTRLSGLLDNSDNKNKVPTTKYSTLKDYIEKPLGLILVELSRDCGYLRGAPLSGKGVLVSWTKTEVRVFGGAILRTVAPFCVRV